MPILTGNDNYLILHIGVCASLWKLEKVEGRGASKEDAMTSG
jgi:hypothetical protein